MIYSKCDTCYCCNCANEYILYDLYGPIQIPSLEVLQNPTQKVNERGIRLADIRQAIQSGKIIEYRPDDYRPFLKSFLTAVPSFAERDSVAASSKTNAHATFCI